MTRIPGAGQFLFLSQLVFSTEASSHDGAASASCWNKQKHGHGSFCDSKCASSSVSVNPFLRGTVTLPLHPLSVCSNDSLELITGALALSRPRCCSCPRSVSEETTAQVWHVNNPLPSHPSHSLPISVSSLNAGYVPRKRRQEDSPEGIASQTRVVVVLLDQKLTSAGAHTQTEEQRLHEKCNLQSIFIDNVKVKRI